MGTQKQVFFAETSHDAIAAIRIGTRIAGELLFIALRPEASYVFERNNIPFRTRNDYIRIDDANTVGAMNDESIEAISLLIDDAIQKKFCSSHLFPANDCFISLKILFDVVSINASVIYEILAKEGPCDIHIFPKQLDRSREHHLPYSSSESVYSDICMNIDWGVRIIREVTSDTSESNCLPVPSQGIWSSLKKKTRKEVHQSSLFGFFYVLDRKGFLPALKILFRSIIPGNRFAVLIYGSGYNWDDSLEQLSCKGIGRVYHIEDSEIFITLKPDENFAGWLMDFCQNTPEILSRMCVKTVDLSPVILPKLIRFIEDSFSDAKVAYDFAQKYITERRIRALLLSTRDTPKGGHLIRASRNHGIPVISWQHGGAGYFDLPIQMYSELKGSDIHLVFGEGVKKTFEQTCSHYPRYQSPKIIPVGSSSLDLLTSHNTTGRRQNRKLHIVYISTVYHNNMFYYPFRTKGGDFDESLWGFQRKMLDLARNHPDCDVTVKLYPSHTSKEPLQSYITDHSIQNVRLVVTENTVTDLIADGDIIVFDIITTAILQTLSRDLPIFVFSGIYQPEREADNLLRERAYISSDPDECIDMISQYLDGSLNAEGVNPANVRFLKCYGTYMNDGRSGERAASIVHETLEYAGAQHNSGNNEAAIIISGDVNRHMQET